MSTGRTRFARIRDGLTPREWLRVGGMALTIIVLNVVGWTLLALALSGNYHLSKTEIFGFGTGILAYTLGMRHAFDADHISAIDNTTRKLMAEGRRPLSVGFWFSLGHSTIVFALALAISLGVRALDGPLRNGSSGLHRVTSFIGTGVSGLFLYLIAAINLAILVSLVKVFVRARRGGIDEQALEEQLNKRGLMSRYLGRLTRRVRKPEQMYPIGLLFGLGFDTATEVALLVIAGSAGAAGLPWYAILCLPVLFAAGMSLLDSIDGSFMNFAYGWAFSNPVRKVYYNLTVTGISILVAFVIGTIELGGLLAQQLGAPGSSTPGTFWNWFENIDINVLGFVIVGLFVLTWAAALAIWRLGRFEERAAPAPAQPERGGA